MNNVSEKFLPIGTIVNLNNNNRKIMVTGFFKKDPVNNNYFDYSGCIYPEGSIDGIPETLFNHEQIVSVLYSGMINEEEKAYKEKLNAFVNNINNTNKAVAGNVSNNANSVNNIPTNNENNTGIRVLDINNIDLTPTSSSQNDANNNQQQKKETNYVFGPDGTIIGME